MRDNELWDVFADVWCAMPKVVFSRTLDSVHGNARLAEGSVAEEVAAALAATDKDVSIGGAGLAAAAIELALVGSCAILEEEITTSLHPFGVHALSMSWPSHAPNDPRRTKPAALRR